MITSILIGHLVGDYFLQTRWMFAHKSPFNGALLAHVFVYSLSLFAFLAGFLALSGQSHDGILFYVAINAFLHLVVDGISSKVTKVYLKRFDYGSFFVALGIDQTAHMIILINTL